MMTPQDPILGRTDPTATVHAAVRYVDSRTDLGPIVHRIVETFGLLALRRWRSPDGEAP